MIKAVFCDVDNTLTSPESRGIPARALEAIRIARKNGIKVFAATGRQTRAYEEGKILHGIELDGFAICLTAPSSIKPCSTRGMQRRFYALPTS